jgi:general secretion pathway protein D
MKSSKKLKTNVVSLMLVTLGLTACANAPQEKVSPKSSFLKSEQANTLVTNAEILTVSSKDAAEKSAEEQHRFRFVAPLKLNTNQATTADDVLNQFSADRTIKITADSLSLQDFLHQVLGQQLAVSYILSDDIKNDQQAVTLSLQQAISEKKLFSLTEELLTERKYIIRFDDNIFYIHKLDEQGNQGQTAYGYGNKVGDVPQTSLNIIQMVPFEFGYPTSMPLMLRQLLGITARANLDSNGLTVLGKRKEIIRALEFIQLMDKPSMQNRHIALYKSTFIGNEILIPKIKELLGQEGLTVGGANITNTALSIIELEKQGQLIFFANNVQVIERAVFWAKQMDQPSKTIDKQYFIYNPQYSRVADMGESLEALISNSTNLASNTSAASQNEQTSTRRVISASSKELKMVVDERANSLIFLTTGEEYRKLLPLIKRLDVMPKQIMLEVMIAEVQLSDEFEQGVAFKLSNQGTANVTGGFNLASGSTGLSYLLNGIQGSLDINLFQSNTLVNILSRPSLLVRDGVAATITVGNDIPTVGEIITDPVNGSRSSVVYRKTGVDLSVTPTINAQGIVIMEINQKISNQAIGSAAVAGSPIIFERSINTEVVAESGQTIILGGLISEDRTLSDTGVPFFSAIPLLGKLFDGNSDTNTKSELVIMVTPRVVESNEEWLQIRQKLSQELEYLDIGQ